MKSCTVPTTAAIAVAIALVLASPATVECVGGVVDYLTGAELQCESSQLPWVAGSIEFILNSDESEIRAHVFPSYTGQRMWALGRFITAYFVPDHMGATLGSDPAAEICTVEARTVLRELYRRLLPEITWARVPDS